jgi:hypothetical protein
LPSYDDFSPCFDPICASRKSTAFAAIELPVNQEINHLKEVEASLSAQNAVSAFVKQAFWLSRKNKSLSDKTLRRGREPKQAKIR